MRRSTRRISRSGSRPSIVALPQPHSTSCRRSGFEIRGAGEPTACQSPRLTWHRLPTDCWLSSPTTRRRHSIRRSPSPTDLVSDGCMARPSLRSQQPHAFSPTTNQPPTVAGMPRMRFIGRSARAAAAGSNRPARARRLHFTTRFRSPPVTQQPCGCGCRPALSTAPSTTSIRSSRSGRPRPMPSTPRSVRRRPRPTSGSCSDGRWPGFCGPSRPISSTWRSGSMATTPPHLLPRVVSGFATSTGGTSTRCGCSRCPTPGNTHGLRPGIWRSTA